MDLVEEPNDTRSRPGWEIVMNTLRVNTPSGKHYHGIVFLGMPKQPLVLRKRLRTNTKASEYADKVLRRYGALQKCSAEKIPIQVQASAGQGVGEIIWHKEQTPETIDG